MKERFLRFAYTFFSWFKFIFDNDFSHCYFLFWCQLTNDQENKYEFYEIFSNKTPFPDVIIIERADWDWIVDKLAKHGVELESLTEI